MNIIQFSARTTRLALCAAVVATFTGCTTYVEERPSRVYVAPPPPPPPPPVVVEAPPPPPAVVVIQAPDDFYEPLSPYGRWVDVPDYGRCWVPAHVEADWRPYSNGHWERTDAGWFWASDEPWGWATYHYGRWDFRPEFGWYWVPQTQWAPAWVAWRSGGDYVGWAPLPPSARYDGGVRVEVDVNRIPARSFGYVEQRHFMDNHRPATVIVNNTTIINKTVNITNIKVVNQTIINEGPATGDIEHATGRTIHQAPVRDLRHTAEEPVATHRPAPARPAAPPPPPAAIAKPAPAPITEQPTRAKPGPTPTSEQPTRAKPGPAPTSEQPTRAKPGAATTSEQPTRAKPGPAPAPAARPVEPQPEKKAVLPRQPQPEEKNAVQHPPEKTAKPEVPTRKVPEPAAKKPAPAAPTRAKPAAPEKPESRSSTNDVKKIPGQQ